MSEGLLRLVDCLNDIKAEGLLERIEISADVYDRLSKEVALYFQYPERPSGYLFGLPVHLSASLPSDIVMFRFSDGMEVMKVQHFRTLNPVSGEYEEHEKWTRLWGVRTQPKKEDIRWR